MGADGSNIKLVSPEFGRTTCSYFYPDGVHENPFSFQIINFFCFSGVNVIYSQTTLQQQCPPTPDQNFGYVWPVYKV